MTPEEITGLFILKRFSIGVQYWEIIEIFLHTEIGEDMTYLQQDEKTVHTTKAKIGLLSWIFNVKQISHCMEIKGPYVPDLTAPNFFP